MTKPSNFIKNSDYKSPGNDDEKTISLTIPATIFVNAGGQVEYHSDLAIGKRNAPMITQLSNSKGSGFIAPASCITVLGDSFTWSGVGTYPEWWTSAYIYRLNPTTVRLQCIFDNSDGPPGSTLTVTGAAQTITAKIKTLQDPFSN